MKIKMQDYMTAMKFMAKLNSVPLEQIVFEDDTGIINIPQDEIEDWKFTGLSNKDFVRCYILTEEENDALIAGLPQDPA